MKYAVDLPDWVDIDGPWRAIEYFETKKEATNFATEAFGADEEGRINIISELPIDDLEADEK